MIRKTAFIAAAILLGATTGAQALVLSPSQVTADNGVADGAPNGAVRTDLDNAIDGNLATFFSLGAGGSLTVDISPLQLASPATLIEVTFGSPNPNFPESAKIFFGASEAGEVFNDGNFIQNAGFSINAVLGGNGATFAIGFDSGSFSTLTILDTTLDNFAGSYGGQGQPATTDGFDVSEISVDAAVPVPAPFLLMGTVLAGLGFAGRRRAKA